MPWDEMRGIYEPMQCINNCEKDLTLLSLCYDQTAMSAEQVWQYLYHSHLCPIGYDLNLDLLVEYCVWKDLRATFATGCSQYSIFLNYDYDEIESVITFQFDCCSDIIYEGWAIDERD